MNWTELLNAEIEGAYGAVDGLVAMVTDDDLAWKPATGENWMTVGQLLEHLTTACGFCMKGIATGDWTPPEGASFPEQEDCEGGLAPAVKMPTVKSVADAKARIAADRVTAEEMVRTTGEMDLAGKTTTVPWNQETPRTLGHHFLHMLDHLASHKSQLFYYLKLMGRKVDTNTLWGG